MHKFVLAAAIGAALAAPAALADETTEDPGWSGNGELGLALSKGNTDSETLIGKLGLVRELAGWRHELGLAFLYGQQDDVESAYRYEVFAKTNGRIGERHSLSGSLRNQRDHYAAYEYQSSIAFGYVHEAIATDTTHLTFEIAPGYRWSKLQGIRVHEDGAIARGFLEFDHRFNDSTSLFDTLLIEAGRNNTFARNDFGVKVKMSDALSLKAGIEVRHNTDVRPGRERTDTLTTVNVAYGF